MTIRILTRDPVSEDPKDGYEWRARHRLIDPPDNLIRGYLDIYEGLGYTESDSLRVERIERKDATTCPAKPNS